MGPKCASMTKLPLSVTTGPAFCTAYGGDKLGKLHPQDNKIIPSILTRYHAQLRKLWFDRELTVQGLHDNLVSQRYDLNRNTLNPLSAQGFGLFPVILNLKMWVDSIYKLSPDFKCSLPAIMTNFFAALATTISWNWQAPPPFQTKKKLGNW